MGKATRWFRSVLGLKCSSDSHKSNNNKKIRKWSFVKSYREKHQTLNHAMPLRLTTATPTIYTGAIAAVKIQSAFRGYLARRALRALKGLVRLQALVRGHIVRRRTAEWFRQMQALLSAQARARAGRFQVSDSPNSSGKSSHLSNPGPATPEKFEYNIRARSLNYYQPSVYERNCSYPHGSIIDGQDRCLEVDSGKSHTVPKRKNAMPSKQHSLIRDHDSLTMSKDSGTRFSVPSYYSCEVQYSCPFNFSNKVDESPFCTATNSPQIFSASSRGASSRRSPFTPTKSDGSRSYLSGYSDCPSYMAYTECSRAKVRSLSAPKQRPQYERSTSTKRHSIHGFAETKTSSEKLSSLQKSFTTKAYPGSGRLDRLGMPVRGDGFGFRY